jgi:hypothetical protein
MRPIDFYRESDDGARLWSFPAIQLTTSGASNDVMDTRHPLVGKEDSAIHTPDEPAGFDHESTRRLGKIIRRGEPGIKHNPGSLF